MLSEKFVVSSAKAVATFIAEQKPADIVGTSLQDAITEVWELNPDEVEQVACELIRMGFSATIQPKQA